MADPLKRMYPESPAPPQPVPPTVARPGPNPANPYDDMAQRIVREAEQGAEKRSDVPFRERAGQMVDPYVSTDAGRFGNGRGE